MDQQLFDNSVDLLQALLWQYNNATNLQGILNFKQDWYNSENRDFWDDWYTDVFNLNTLNDFGCSVWAIILGINFITQIEPDLSRGGWGFGPYGKNFFDGNFGASSTQVIELTTAQKRLVLKLRYFQLISRGTVPETNKFLADLFGKGNAWVEDNLDMTITVFIKKPDTETLFILNNYDLLPRPAGVGLTISIFVRNGWGFGPYALNFYNGNFVS